MILTSTADIKKYIPVAGTFVFSVFEPYIQKAINSYTCKYVGALHTLLDQETATGQPNAAIKNEARELLRTAIANFAYFLYTPYASIIQDSSGMSVVNNENRKPIEWWQLNDIRRELLRSGHEAMDFLLALLEKNTNVFSEWNAEFNTPEQKLLVNTTVDFQSAYNIFDSRQTFIALRPSIIQVEDQYLKRFISSELLEELKGTVTLNKKLLKEYLQKAIVAFTIAKIYNEGIFHIDASGIKLKFDTLPNEKVQAVDYGKQAEQLQRAVKIYIDNGTNYILLAKQLIQDEPNDFPSGALANENPITAIGYNTKGIFSL